MMMMNSDRHGHRHRYNQQHVMMRYGGATKDETSKNGTTATAPATLLSLQSFVEDPARAATGHRQAAASEPIITVQTPSHQSVISSLSKDQSPIASAQVTFDFIPELAPSYSCGESSEDSGSQTRDDSNNYLAQQYEAHKISSYSYNHSYIDNTNFNPNNTRIMIATEQPHSSPSITKADADDFTVSYAQQQSRYPTDSIPHHHNAAPSQLSPYSVRSSFDATAVEILNSSGSPSANKKSKAISDAIVPSKYSMKKQRKRRTLGGTVGGALFGGIVLGPIGAVAGAAAGGLATKSICKHVERRAQRKFERKNFQKQATESNIHDTASFC
eukprot:CAMPEP_0119556478 /NCGR_PEP_ID=MMETSP1352-20130426/8417_1 /TAXON_ID=265584 /ORGANISM="Stauroneis constricta, Strain CCMP1120" /LENGTH=328 /DNA_ID=CAMNT_0007603441 /DNA_START=128 /DNA_END=1114 /DNA_ORIENTATION=+